MLCRVTSVGAAPSGCFCRGISENLKEKKKNPHSYIAKKYIMSTFIDVHVHVQVYMYIYRQHVDAHVQVYMDVQMKHTCNSETKRETPSNG